MRRHRGPDQVQRDGPDGGLGPPRDHRRDRLHKAGAGLRGERRPPLRGGHPPGLFEAGEVPLAAGERLLLRPQAARGRLPGVGGAGPAPHPSEILVAHVGVLVFPEGAVIAPEGFPQAHAAAAGARGVLLLGARLPAPLPEQAGVLQRARDGHAWRLGGRGRRRRGRHPGGARRGARGGDEAQPASLAHGDEAHHSGLLEDPGLRSARANAPLVCRCRL
mmetsp:Transcript_99847/g.311033  ORF Transcript_99847/g.311033 Transcript_99847/m.311033 type:complete len:219 (+) Transcript_99847:661-1317(+)